MEVIVHHHKVFKLIDTLLERWNASPKRYPYNRPDAIIPQNVIPDSIRKDTFALACFYFYVCIYMRGGIESLQAFNAMLKMREKHPLMFDPYHASLMTQEEVQAILKEFVGWDSKNASINWVENSKRLMRNWKGNPLNLIKKLDNYEEALRRIKNKLTKKEIAAAGPDGEGFRGFQPKMVSMILYFYDWEKLLKKRFHYPAPADFHNFRLGLAIRAMEVDLKEGETIRAVEKISAPWRDAVMAYLKEHDADPIEVADAIWLFSLVMCGNSSAPTTSKQPLDLELFSHASVEIVSSHDQRQQWSMAKNRKKLEQTCYICPLAAHCDFAVPSKPYYTKGMLVLLPRIRPEASRYLEQLREPSPSEVILKEEGFSFEPQASPSPSL